MPETERGFFSPGGAGLFSFFANEPTSHEALLHRRKIAEALAAQKKGMPKNVGEGLTYLGESIGEAGLAYRLRAAEQARERMLGGVSESLERGGPAVAAPAAAVTPGPRAAIEPDPAVAETVAAAEADPAASPQLAYAPPTSPADPALATPTAAPLPSVLPPPVRPAPQPVQQAPQQPGATPAPQPYFMPPAPLANSMSVRGAELSGGGELPPPSAPPSHGVLAGATMPPQSFQGGTQVASQDDFNELDAAAPNLVADVPLPRSRGEAPAAVADGGFNAMDQGAVNRGNPMVRGVNPRLIEAVNAGALALPEGHTVRISSGHRAGDSGYHGRGSAIDVKIVRPDGTEIPSRGEDKTGLYTQLARGAYTHALKNDQHIAWGGAFDTAKRGGTGNRDLMHFDTGPERGNLDPSLRLSRLGPLPANFDPNAPGGGTQVAARDPRAAITDAIMAGGQMPPEAAQVARSRDVLGGGTQGGPMPRTASLGRAGVVSDEVPLGVNPVSPSIDAGVAEAVQKRNAIANEILQQQNKVPVPEEPVTGPTQAGTGSSPTTVTDLPAVTGSQTSPRLAQVLGPSGASPPLPATQGAVRAAPAPAIPNMELPPKIGEAPPAYTRPRPVEPAPPTRPPMGPQETYAQKVYRSTDDPEIQRRAAAVIAQHQKVRDDAYARDIEAYKEKMKHHSTLDNAWIKDQVEARQKDLELRHKANEITLQAQTQAQTLGANAPPAGELNTPNSPQQTGIPTIPPAPPGISPDDWKKAHLPKAIAAADAVEKAEPDFKKGLKVIELARSHPGRESGLGFWGALARRTPGTAAAGFGAVVDELAGKNFLSAYAGLRGTGAISEAEGKKAEQAQARLSTAQSKEDFDAALNDLEEGMRGDLELAQRKANKPVTAYYREGDQQRYAPDIGTLGQRGGKNVRYIGGNPKLNSSYEVVQ